MPKKPLPKNESGPWLRAMGRRIRGFREAQGLTQETLAERTDFAPRTIQKIEAGQITSLSTTVMRIRRVLGCRYDDLMPD